MNSSKVIIVLLLLFNCFKAKRAQFDFGNSSTSTVIAGNFANLPNSSQTSSSNTTTEAVNTLPNTVSYSGAIGGLYKVFPSNPVNFVPTIDSGSTVQSWSITPNISAEIPGLSFNQATGAITGTPTSPAGANTITKSYTITAKANNYTKDFSINIEILGSGANVWTVLNGVSGGNTRAGTNAMKYDSTCNCLYIAGTTTVNLDGQTIPSTGGNTSGYISKYDLNGNKIWTRVFGTTGAVNTSPTGLVTDNSGNIYITGLAGIGNFNGINITTSASWPSGAGYVIKFDPNGNTVWTSISAPSVLHYYSGIVIANNGNVVVAGTVVATSIDGMTNTAWSDQSAIIQEFNSNTGTRVNGQIVPGNTSPSRGTDAMGLSKDSTGNIYAVIATRTTLRCGDGSVNWRPALFRFNSSLGYINCHPVPTGGSVPVFGFGVTTTPSGESYISGYSTIAIDSIAPIGFEDGFVTKFNSTGIIQWTRRLGVSSAKTSILSVVYDSTEDRLYFTGITGGALQGNSITGTKDMFVAKYDTAGTQVWLKMQGMQNDTEAAENWNPTSITFDSNRTLYSFGDTNGTIGGQTNPASPNRSMFLVRNVQ